MTNITHFQGFEKVALSYGTDIPNLDGNHKKYLYGPGTILVAHGDNERIDKSDLYEAVKGYKRIVRAILEAKAVIVHEPPKEDPITASLAPIDTPIGQPEAPIAIPVDSGKEGEPEAEYVTILPVDTP